MFNRFLLLLLVGTFCITGQSFVAGATEKPLFQTTEAELWADSVLNKLNLEQRIAQLFMVAAWSNKDSTHIKEIRSLITEKGIGGLIFFQGGPVREALLTNDYQAISRVPLLIGMDAEWGISMRLDSTLRFPRQMTMAAIANDSAVYKMGNEIARNCKRLGIHVNFAPDADINNNPSNPVIGSRSFGDDRENVALKSISYMRALQDNHILPTGKHFPGHGNVDVDSHFALPLIVQNSEELDSMELYPFQAMIDAGLMGIMVAHLNVPSLEKCIDLPSTLSSSIINTLLKEKMGFNGIVFTDALNMKGVTLCFKPGILEKLALIAGNDILLYSEDINKSIEEISIAIDNNEISKENIDNKVRKLLMVKYWCGLNNQQFIDTTNLFNDLNTPHAQLLQKDLYEKAVTLLVNKDSLLPFRSKDSLRIACVVIGDKLKNPFQERLLSYENMDLFYEDKDAAVSVFNALYGFLANYDYVIVSLHGTTMKAQNNFGISEAANKFIDSVLISYKTVFVNFGNAYTLTRFNNLKSAQSLILAYEDIPITQSIAAQIIMGGVEARGKIPVNVSKEFSRNSGLSTAKPIRLKYTIPEAEGMSSIMLNKIDSIALNAIRAGATPGCQVLVARNGSVVYQKSFGKDTYDSTDSISNSDLYDVASITKIAATALATMRLYEKKKINLNAPSSKYLPELKKGNKNLFTLSDMLTHQAGLKAWIPFYKETLSDSGYLQKKIYRSTKNEMFSIHVADSIYLKTNYSDTILNRIYNSPITDKGKYIYSDLGPILMKEIIENITKLPLDKYVDDNFYKPLKLNRTGFNPRNKFALKEIVPTEIDTVFRKQLIHGFVHDPAAAMFGGVSGNAGLFSNANGLAVIMQMLLNKGTYGGQRFFKPETVDLFTGKQFANNRRGLLFDKPETDTTKQSPCTKAASPLTFGHQGFTGTCAWADPEYGLIYIFLSNRVYPTASNEKLSKMNVRTAIQEIIYNSFLSEPNSAN
jgi:beta-glucosidase-like glycosyl hydrolase/CubicO group peptidase (beta-lactamase class C family)